MNFLKYLQTRILSNKVKKGFPIGDYDYDFKKLREEIDEFELSVKEGKGIPSEEAADVIIMTLGIMQMLDPNKDMRFSILSKIHKNERRLVTKVGHNHFEKKEN